VIVCLPEDVALVALGPIVEAMGEGSLWIDALSVKSGVCRSLRGRTEPIEILSIHPMFAPALRWRGNRVAAIEVAGGPKSAAMIDLLLSWGAHVERLSAADHDAQTAAIQVATHAAVLAFGAALLELDYDPAAALRLATPPHRLMLALLNRMVNANPAVYSEIQRHHPQAGAVRQAMSRALEAIAAGSGDDRSLDALPRWFEDLRILLSAEQGYLGELSDRVVAQVSGEP
jgi:prephenate dehydrogenase